MVHSVLVAVFGMDPQEAQAKLDKLTAREKEVAEQLAMGLANAEIAEKFKISRKTLDIHRNNVKRKLDTTTQGIGRVWFLAHLARSGRKKG